MDLSHNDGLPQQSLDYLFDDPLGILGESADTELNPSMDESLGIGWEKNTELKPSLMLNYARAEKARPTSLLTWETQNHNSSTSHTILDSEHELGPPNELRSVCNNKKANKDKCPLKGADGFRESERKSNPPSFIEFIRATGIKNPNDLIKKIEQAFGDEVSNKQQRHNFSKLKTVSTGD